MIETERAVMVDAPIGVVWNYASDFPRWAEIMPGYQQAEIIDADNSRWVLKVGVGGLVRTVKVRVHVDRWAGPERVDFSFELEGDPVSGSGSYLASARGPAATELALQVRVVGSGAMAPMWEAMGGPLLPKFARGFAEQLKRRIEIESDSSAADEVLSPDPRRGLAGRLMAWLRGWVFAARRSGDRT